MEAIVDFWNSIGEAGQSALIGMIASVVVFVLHKLFPRLKVYPNQVKRVVIAVMTGLSAYVATGQVGAALAAALSAFGTYQLATGK